MSTNNKVSKAVPFKIIRMDDRDITCYPELITSEHLTGQYEDITGIYSFPILRKEKNKYVSVNKNKFIYEPSIKEIISENVFMFILIMDGTIEEKKELIIDFSRERLMNCEHSALIVQDNLCGLLIDNNGVDFIKSLPADIIVASIDIDNDFHDDQISLLLEKVISSHFSQRDGSGTVLITTSNSVENMPDWIKDTFNDKEHHLYKKIALIKVKIIK